MLNAHWIAALFALFVWWFSTGAILWAVKRADLAPKGAHGRVVLASLPLLVAGVAGAVLAEGPYGGFLSALAIWGWIEIAFLTGCITGPERGPLPRGLGGGARFRAAWSALMWHELLLAGGLALLWLGAEEMALWTYAVLWTARLSAKFNIFLGVPRINEAFLPRPLAHLPSYFRRAPVGGFWWLSVALLAAGVLALIWAARDGDLRFALLAALGALALLEHLLMAVPLPDAKLWKWALPGGARDGL